MTYSKTYKVKNNKKKRVVKPNRYKKHPRAVLVKKTFYDSVKRALLILFLVVFTSIFFVSVFLLVNLQNISKNLPSPDKPFGTKETATEIYDRNGKLLYRVFDDEDRDPVNLEDIPPLLVWTYLAAEDIRFYEHDGIDLGAIGRCAIRLAETNTITCGGSTVTQQLIRKTTLTDDVNLDRKLKEMILAMKIEELRSKEEILEMYLTIVPSGSNIYGVTRAANFYFGKTPKELTLSEMAVLASIPQNPSVLSPTKSTNPDIALDLLAQRRSYIFNQLESNLDYINSQYKSISGNDVQLLDESMIKNARSEEPIYADPAFNINAPHFVFYVLDALQKEGFKDGNPLTLEEIETQGYKIYTTLDLDIQVKAENAVKKAVDIYGATYGADNAGLITLDPTTGEVLAMVGSYNYFGKSTPANCIAGLNCKFEPQVNVVDSLQAYGSTLKPIIYYQSFMNGTITPESTIVDAPIKIGNYTPKNYDGKFSGVQTARSMLVNSRNIPAIILLDKITVPGFVTILKDWGYTTMTNPNGYGLSLAVGGGEITLLEHAQAYGIFANNGILTTNNVVAKIVDSSNQTIYSSTVSSSPVADPRGIYMVNDILNGKNSGPGFSFDGRDVAGKTGTSEDQKETLYVAYSPEFVVAGMLVNNDNSPMRYGATGFTSVRPWVGEYLKEIGSYFPATDFTVPFGIEFPSNGDILITDISRQQKNVGMEYTNYINRQISRN